MVTPRPQRSWLKATSYEYVAKTWDVRVRSEDLGGCAGAAARHHVDDVEVVQREDEGQEDRHEHHVLEPRQRDVPEAPPRGSAVHRRRLVELPRDRLHAGQVRHAEERK